MTTRVLLYGRIGNNDGGRARFVKSLVRGFYEINAPDVEFVVVTHPEFDGWARPYAEGPLDDGNVTVVSRPWTGPFERAKAHLRPVIPYVRPVAKPLVDRLEGSGSDDVPTVPEMRPFFRSQDPDVVHWLARYWERSDRPMAYNLGDLQDRHYPEYFEESTRTWRDVFCQGGCEAAETIITASEFVANDIVTEYGVARDKIAVVYRGPPTQYDAVTLGPEAVCERFDLDPGFAFYPAKKWPHKNHDRLLRALDRVRNERDVALSLVCTGSQHPTDQFWELKRLTNERGLEDAVHWLGYVDESELLALYRASGFLVFPTLFEGQGFPLVEAFDVGTAVVCSDIPPLREYGGAAPRYFDPESVPDIADAIAALATDESLRTDLEAASRDRSADYSWEQTAREYAHIYRSLDSDVS